MSEIIPVKLTKKALNEFIGWTTSRYNDYMGYGTKKEAVERAFRSIQNGFLTYAWYNNKKGTWDEEKREELKVVFEIKCAGAVGTSDGMHHRKVKQSGDIYTIDCIAKTITAQYSKKIIQFI